MKTKTIDNWEIFSAGTWNGNTYTVKDIDEIVESFEPTKSFLKPFLKLGHDAKQKLLQKDGFPSAGWITELKRVGKKLIAKVEGIPDKIYNLISTRAYGRVSSEIYKNATIKGIKYKRALKAVALLGGDTPAVGSLNDFIDLYIFEDEYYNFSEKQETEQIEYYKKEAEMPKIEVDVEQYTQLQTKASLYAKGKIEADKFEATMETYSKKIKSLENSNKELETYKVDMEKKSVELFEKEVDMCIDNFVKDEKITPAEADFYKIMAKKSTEDFTLYKEHLSKLKGKAEFSDDTKTIKTDSKKDQNEDDKLVEMTNKIVAEKGLSYKDATIEAYSMIKEGK